MSPTLWIFHSSFVCLSPLLPDWKSFFSSCGKGSQPSQLPDQTKSSKTFTASAEKFSFNEKSRRRLSSLEPGKRTLLSGPAKSDHEQSGRFYRKQFYAILSTVHTTCTNTWNKNRFIEIFANKQKFSPLRGKKITTLLVTTTFATFFYFLTTCDQDYHFSFTCYAGLLARCLLSPK